MALGLNPQLGIRPQEVSLGGLISARPLSSILAEEAKKAAADSAATARSQAQRPVIQELVDQVKSHWSIAKEAKQQVELEMLQAVRARRGEYEPDKLTQIRRQGGSEIYMMLFATKARQLKALLTDTLMGAGTEKPWTMQATPKPDLPPQDVQAVMQTMQQQVMQAEMMGMPLSVDDIRQRLIDAKNEMENRMMAQARAEAERAEAQVEDMLVEGDFMEALNAFLDDLTTFKTAFVKGPVVRMANDLEWVAGPEGSYTPKVTQKARVFWERVDPLNIYPAPWATSVNDGFLIERHKLSRSSLSALIGVDGYSEEAIRAALNAHGDGGLHEWLSVDASRADAEGRLTSADEKRSDLIDALQYWGSVSGKMLREWGMSELEAPDEAKEYEVELWLVGEWVIKAMINPDPLQRRPYFADGFSRVPGAFWHNSLYDTIRDCCDMCNGAARALANNLGISSGPQVVMNVERLPQGEDLTEMYPWKIWQVTNDPMGSSAKPVDFFQPGSNVAELMGVYERFSQLADEYSGVPKYMAGLNGGEGGAGRTASGMSMMIGNASKQIKSTLSSIDLNVLGPVVERAYQHLLQYSPEAGIKGDLHIRARGAMSLVAKEAAQVRINEFLQATGNPIDMQIVGMEGRAELLRQAAKRLDVNPDKIVPSESSLKMKAAQAQMMAVQMAQAQQAHAADPQAKPRNGQELQNGAPVTDNFQPARQQ